MSGWGHAPDDNTAHLASLADIHDELASSADDAKVEELPRGSALLVVKRGPNAGAQFRLEAPAASVGRHPISDIYLDDITVSRRHAEIRRDAAGAFRVVDLGSLNSTYLNREPVDSAVLSDGDELQVGNFRLVFLAGMSSSRAP
ncbi:FHA domain-containing protein [Mycobacterium sp. THU-M104]|uniref:FHA domain-containing protein n=1 Tax=Mycobacterium sp. THU-M104 TaxID=3410515 RepID=UPI003B9AD8B5